ncbi:MAG: tRNA 2-thiouridine(34) synthase MnmA, partial [Bacteroidetes bacterium]
AFGKPMFVTEIRPETNTVVLGELDELVKNGMRVGQVVNQKYASIPDDLETVTKIRYRDPGTLATLRQTGDQVAVTFLANVRGVAPGQSAVFYEGEDVVGGGIIYSGTLNEN